MDDALSLATDKAANEIRRNRTMLDFALLYADEGLRVLPLQSLRSPDCCTCGFASCGSVAKYPRTFPKNLRLKGDFSPLLNAMKSGMLYIKKYPNENNCRGRNSYGA